MTILSLVIIVFTLIQYKYSGLNDIQCFMYALYSLLVLVTTEINIDKKKRTNLTRNKISSTEK